MNKIINQLRDAIRKFNLKTLLEVLYSVLPDKTDNQNLLSKEEDNYNLEEDNYTLLIALDAERTEGIIPDLRSHKKLTQEAVSALSRTANIEAIWQGTKDDFDEYGINQCFEYFSQQKDKYEKDKYDVYLLKIKLNEPEKEFNQTMPSTSRQRAFKRLLKKDRSVEVSPRLPRESIENNPHLYR